MRSKSNVGLFLLYLLAAALVVYSVSLVILSNFNMGNLMVWLLTACVVGYTVFRRPLHAWFSRGTGRIVFWVLAALAAIYLAVIAFVSVSGYTNPPGTSRSSLCWARACTRTSPASCCNTA